MVSQHKSPEINPSVYEEVVKKDKSEKKFRKKLFRIEEEIKLARLTKEMLNEKKKENEEEEKNKLKKIEYHEEMKAKAKLRQEENDKLKRIWSQTPEKIKPKYIEMQEAYKANFEFKEAQRTKSELAKKSQYMKNINKSELKEHIKNYEKVILEAKKKREAKKAEFSLENSVNSINIFKRAISVEREELFNAKKNLVVKRKNYGDIVRELFSPKFDLKPLRSEKVVMKKIEPKSFRDSERNSSDSAPPLRIIKKKKVPEPQITETIPTKKKNYLSEMRLNRGIYDRSSEFNRALNTFNSTDIEGDRDSVLKKLKNVEKIVKSEENRIKLSEKGSDLMAEYKLNELLMQSVKAKMQMLGSNN